MHIRGIYLYMYTYYIIYNFFLLSQEPKWVEGPYEMQDAAMGSAFQYGAVTLPAVETYNVGVQTSSLPKEAISYYEASEVGAVWTFFFALFFLPVIFFFACHPAGIHLTCVCVYICNVYIYTYIHAYIILCMSVCVCVFVCTYISIYLSIYIYIYM